MTRWIRLCFTVLLLSQGLAAHADSYRLGFRLAPIDDPWRIEFQPGAKPITGSDFEQIVKIVGATKGWKVVSAAEGRMELMSAVRDHTMSIDMTYDTSGYGIRYLRSTNLKYEEQARSGGTLRVIHGNYNGWIKDLVEAINAGLGVPARTSIGFAPLEKVDAVPFLREKGRDAYREFLSKSMPRAFAIAPNGAWGSASLRLSGGRADVLENAMEFCNRRGNGQCKLYALDGHVVWRSDL